jgi:hypothetical protein
MTGRDMLSQLSRVFCDQLFAAYPEWRPYCRPWTDDPGAVVIEVPSPVPGRSLFCDTIDGEVTIGYDHWHTHFGSYPDLSAEEAVAEALEWIRNILDEKTLIQVDYREGTWEGSSSIEPGSDIALSPGVKTQILSWTGRLDKVYEPT